MLVPHRPCAIRTRHGARCAGPARRGPLGGAVEGTHAVLSADFSTRRDAECHRSSAPPADFQLACYAAKEAREPKLSKDRRTCRPRPHKYSRTPCGGQCHFTVLSDVTSLRCAPLRHHTAHIQLTFLLSAHVLRQSPLRRPAVTYGVRYTRSPTRHGTTCTYMSHVHVHVTWTCACTLL